MVKTVDIEALKKDAVEIFNGGFACSESVIYAVRKHFQLDLSDDVIAMSSGFPWGLGGGGCICGALAGGTMCLGYFFGRRTPGDPCINRCFELTHELHDFFRDSFGAPCCGRLIEGYEKDAPDRKAMCTEIVSGTCAKVAEIVMRELAKG